MAMLAIFTVFKEMWFLEVKTLRDEEVCCLTMSRTNYPVTQHCIPEKQNPEG
jgi:hypothetical protein